LSVQKKATTENDMAGAWIQGQHVVLANQLLSKGMYLSFWFDFALRPESGKLLRHLPVRQDYFLKLTEQMWISESFMRKLLLTWVFQWMN
jgi:hypothetical protein